MQTSVLWLVVPIIVGLSQPLIWQMNLRVARHTGNMESAVILHIIGAVFGLSLALGGLRGGWEGGLLEYTILPSTITQKPPPTV